MVSWLTLLGFVALRLAPSPASIETVTQALAKALGSEKQ
jgi:hypothetical protein